MMAKKCTCSDNKKDPRCPVCSKSDVNLDSFHRLNPEAKPKTAEHFKLAAPGLWGGLQQGTKSRIMDAGKAALTSAVVPAAGAALAAGLSADPGQGWGDAARAGLVGGALGGAAGAAHHMGMTGSSDAAHSYQRGVGGDIRNMGNWGREQMGADLLAHPNTPPAPKPAAIQPPSVVPVPDVLPKTSMFYEFGKSAALATFSI